LDDLLTRRGESIHRMVALEVPEEELRNRLLKRAETSGRVDDADPAVIQKRIDVYNRETAPVAGFYRAQGKYVGVDGVGTLDEITERLVQAIG
jgi:adenylate kinase